MAHIESAKKRLKQSLIRRAHNRATLSDLKTQIKKVLRAVRDNNKEQAEAELRLAFKKLDKCGSRRFIHPNTASRYKARLAKRVQQIGAPTT